MKNLNAKVLILLLMASMGLQAQETTPTTATTPLRFGIHASPNLSYVQSDDPDADGSTNLKFGFGLMMEYNFAPSYSFSTGIDYIFRGGDLTLPVEVEDNSGNTLEIQRTGTYKAGMVQIPLFLKMQTKEFGYMRYFAEFGGRLGFPVDQIAEFEESRPGYELTEKQLEENYVNIVDVMFSIGIGGEYSLGGSTGLVAGVYYNRSLADNIENNGELLGTQKKYNYRFDYINLKVGILF